MPMLTGLVDVVIGVDTHRDSNTAAIVDAVTGGSTASTECLTDALGYKRLIAFVNTHAPQARRVWAIEGTGSYGSGLTTFLLERGEWVVEVDRPARSARRNGAKTDEIDAVRAAREAPGRWRTCHPAHSPPTRPGSPSPRSRSTSPAPPAAWPPRCTLTPPPARCAPN